MRYWHEPDAVFIVLEPVDMLEYNWLMKHTPYNAYWHEGRLYIERRDFDWLFKAIQGEPYTLPSEEEEP